MTAGSPSHDAPPRNATMLATWLDRAANTSGIAAGRLRRQLGFMILAAMLETARDTGAAEAVQKLIRRIDSTARS
jgi:hypothetical protein